MTHHHQYHYLHHKHHHYHHLDHHHEKEEEEGDIDDDDDNADANAVYDNDDSDVNDLDVKDLLSKTCIRLQTFDGMTIRTNESLPLMLPQNFLRLAFFDSRK